MNDAISCLQTWLHARLTEPQQEWLQQACARMRDQPSTAVFYKHFNHVARRLGRDDLQLTAQELEQAQALCDGWQPVDWSMTKSHACCSFLNYI